MTTTIRAACSCGSFNLQIDFPTSSFPIDRAICLCVSCRQISGTFGSAQIVIPSTQTVDISKFDLTVYNSSDSITRHFCTTCGTPVLTNYKEIWLVPCGIWDRTEGLINWTGCKFVERTLDGGVSVWFKEIGEGETKKPMKRWKLQLDEHSVLVPDEDLRWLPERVKTHEGEERLKAKCYCGGVEFYITRPNKASKQVTSPFPDLMIPYNSSESAANPKNEPWWLCSNDTKYLAGTCACNSCRLASGFDIQTWAFVPKPNIFQADGTPLDFSKGTLKRYTSTKKDAIREFCGVCGATAFWHCLERPELIDVAVGLLDPEQGARAESWLEWWTGRVSFKEFAMSKSLVESLESGLKAWGKGGSPPE